MLLRKFRKYSSEGGWGIEWPLRIDKTSVVSIVAGLAVAITIELAQRRSYFRGVEDVDKLIEDEIA